MRRRIYVEVDEAEYQRFREAARKRGLSLANWVRWALRRAGAAETSPDVDRKLAAVRSAARYAFPSGTLDRMLGEIGSGSLDDDCR
jgi:hypothetical protein